MFEAMSLMWYGWFLVSVGPVACSSFVVNLGRTGSCQMRSGTRQAVRASAPNTCTLCFTSTRYSMHYIGMVWVFRRWIACSLGSWAGRIGLRARTFYRSTALRPSFSEPQVTFRLTCLFLGDSLARVATHGAQRNVQLTNEVPGAEGAAVQHHCLTCASRIFEYERSYQGRSR